MYKKNPIPATILLPRGRFGNGQSLSGEFDEKKVDFKRWGAHLRKLKKFDDSMVLEKLLVVTKETINLVRNCHNLFSFSFLIRKGQPKKKRLKGEGGVKRISKG